MTRVQGEAIQLREEREALQVALQVSQRETAEARGLWETEIKSRASMSLRVIYTCIHTVTHTTIYTFVTHRAPQH